MLSCPECQKEIKLPEKCKKGDIFECENCGAELEIISVDPQKVEIILEEK
ncbi:lysine biosynthesis protein LysW [bacterium (Candidatus Torokbacteria) CG_4_10_14_0_2_um_filter_35_8]|nr:MAG: lysine biosynthesis protein LysW [bacterium (Candidatus Torokbacteria) CG_4_10_14_0_2_um_filter_35_8]